MKRILLLSMVLLACLGYDSFAQSRTVTGKVTSEEDDNPVPGVGVVLKGTTRGTITDVDGRYSLEVPGEGGVLQFSFVGLETQEIEIGTSSVIDVEMAQDVQQLGEVVVTAAGIERQ